METKKKKLPVGIEMFRDIREHDFYYIDTTLQLFHKKMSYRTF